MGKKKIYDETILLTQFLIASTGDLLNAVLDECGIVDYQRDAYREILFRQCKNALIAAIWSNLDASQVKHLSEHMREAMIINPKRDHVSILIDFVLMYPELREKIFVELDEFFRGFIEDFRRIRG
jgi:hypothetical protein